MFRKSIIILVLATLTAGAHSQNDSIDQCQYVAVYDFLTNTTDKNGNAVKDSVRLAIMVGRHTAKCMEYNRTMLEDFGEWPKKDYQYGEWDARKYNLPVIFIGFPDGELSSFDKVVPNRYFYTEPLPDFGWELTDDTLTVCGYFCRKAVGKYAGRTWTAWYSEDVAASFGPWKLHGLPGMILKAVSKREQSDASISSAEREQLRPKVKAMSKREQSDARISSAKQEQFQTLVKEEDSDGIFSFICVGLMQRAAPIKYFSKDGYTTLKRDKFIAHRNKLYCSKQYVQQPNYYIPPGTYDHLNIIEMWPGGPEPPDDEKISVVASDMIIPKKVNVYHPLELE